MSDYASKTVIQSHVYHQDKCFFVSTIDRASSAMLGPDRYHETMVWEWDTETRQRKKGILSQHECSLGSINKHFLVCLDYYQNGKNTEEQ